MKKGKFSKGHIALAVMVVALGAAVWLNMKYSGAINDAASDTASKYLGQAEYVSGEVKEEEKSYFTQLKDERQQAREASLEIIDEILDREELTDEDKKAAVEKANALADTVNKENSIESILKAKGFSEVAVMIGDADVNVVIKAKELTTAQTAQIKDAVTSQTSFSAAHIKIITVE